MLIIATQKNVRQSPRKVRLVANTVKDLSLSDALRQLAVIERRASLVVLKVVKQAIANAMNNHQLAYDNLVLKSIQVTSGATYKRFQAVSRGRAHSIQKKTSHVRVILETKDQKPETVQPVAKAETAPVAQKTETKKAAPKKATATKATKAPKTTKNSTSKGKTK